MIVLVGIMLLLFIALQLETYVPKFVDSPSNSKEDLMRGLVRSGVNGTLDRFRLDVGRYPTTAEGLRALVIRPTDPQAASKWCGPYVKSLNDLRDAWGTELIYAGPPRGGVENYQLSSAGPDKVPGTDDDITNWQK